MRFREIIPVNFENYTNHINTLFGQNEESFFDVEACGNYSNHCVLRD
jgi:hypothetical protein